jgi:hypothetical protein
LGTSSELDLLAHPAEFGLDQKQCRLRVVDPDHGAAVGRNGNAGERARGLDLAEQFSLRQTRNAAKMACLGRAQC